MFRFILFLLVGITIIATLFWIWKAEERNKDDLCETCAHKHNLDNIENFKNSVCKSCSRSNLMYESDITVNKEIKQ